MIHELKVEQQRIQDAVDVLRRLQRIRKPSSARFDGRGESPDEVTTPEARKDPNKSSSVRTSEDIDLLIE
jgi:hypothetical protein